VVRVVEDMLGDDNDFGSVKVTTRDLANKLRLSNLRTASERLVAAVACGALEQDDNMSGPGGARYFRVLKGSNALEAEPESDLSTFPPPEVVRKIFFLGHPPENKEQREQKGTKGTKEGTTRI
jgi:hypothetical protein